MYNTVNLNENQKVLVWKQKGFKSLICTPIKQEDLTI